jgi:hypothetical protein
MDQTHFFGSHQLVAKLLIPAKSLKYEGIWATLCWACELQFLHHNSKTPPSST